MAQRKQLTLSELRVAVFVLLALFILGIGIFYVTGQGTPFAPKYRVRTYLSEVEGLQTGAPVRLDGVQIGWVESIRLNPQASDRMHNIEILMRIERKYGQWIRTDSKASLITEGLLGNRYVTIARGSLGQPVPPNGEVPGSEEASTKAIVQRGAELMQNLGVLSQDVRAIVDEVHEGQGTIGALVTDRTLYDRLNAAAAGIQQIVASTQAGQGVLGKLITSDELYTKADSAVGRVDTLIADVQAQKGTLGKLVYDPNVYQQLKEFVEKGNNVIGDVQAGKGTLGKLVTDDTVYKDLRAATANINTATSKLNENQGTMGKFFNDPRFYDNVAGLSGDLRLLIADFRREPKKFLNVRFAIF